MIAGLITARGGSAGLKRKNVLPLGGRPLIAWTIEAALNSRRLDRVIVSTDDDEIARVAESCGAPVPFRRPASISGAASPHMQAVTHALEWLHGEGCEPRYMVVLQPTSPLRTADDIDAAVEIALSAGAPAVVSVVEAAQHPWKIHGLDESGALSPFVRGEIAYARRQALPPAYAENGAIYVIRTDLVKENGTFLPEGTRPYVMPADRSIDIDNTWDMYLAESAIRLKGAGA